MTSAVSAAPAIGLSFAVKAGEIYKALLPASIIATKGIVKEHLTANLISLELEGSTLTATAFGGHLAGSFSISNVDFPELDMKAPDGSNGKATVNANDLMASLSTFADDERVNFEVSRGDTRQLKITLERDPEEYQIVAVYGTDVEIPVLAKKTKSEVVIDRGLLLKGIENVKWALGWEGCRDIWLNWRLVANTDYAQFSAGTGARFAINNYEGKGIVKTAEKTSVCVHKDQTEPLISIIKLSGMDTVTISQSAKETNAPEQMVFDFKTFKILYVGFDPDLKWPASFDKRLEEKRPYNAEISFNNWCVGVKGVAVTYNAEVKKEHEDHQSTISIDPAKKLIQLTSKGTSSSSMKANRKIAIDTMKLEPSDSKKLEFICNTRYLGEIQGKFNDDGKVSFHYYADQGKPLLFVGEKTINGAITEDCMILIATIASA